MSEALPERPFADHAELGDFLQMEMERGLFEALEDQIVSGDGTGENFTGLLTVSGTLAQAWSTDLVTTLRKARTTMAVQGEQPTAWVLNPEDAEAIDLLRDGTDSCSRPRRTTSPAACPWWSPWRSRLERRCWPTGGGSG